jgi:UDP-N-acetylmuramate dehydrogenase
MQIYHDVDLSSLTTFRTPCVAETYIPIKSDEDITLLLGTPTLLDKPWLILWWWSNILFTQPVVSQTILHNCISGIERLDGDRLDDRFDYSIGHDSRFSGIPHVSVLVGWGTPRSELITWMLKNNLYWLENLTAIPGSVGASPVQNIGAYWTEVSSCIHSVICYDLVSGVKHLLPHTSCAFWYRDSIFKNELKSRLFISHVLFSLPIYDPETYMPQCSYPDIQQWIHDHSLDVRSLTPNMLSSIIAQIRAKKFPDLSQHGCAGSFFKNCIVPSSQFLLLKERFPEIVWYPDSLTDTVKIPTWRILDHLLHVKWVRHWSVGCREQQALVIVNYDGHASGQAIADFAQWLQERVYITTGLHISPEVSLI